MSLKTIPIAVLTQQEELLRVCSVYKQNLLFISKSSFPSPNCLLKHIFFKNWFQISTKGEPLPTVQNTVSLCVNHQDNSHWNKHKFIQPPISQLSVKCTISTHRNGSGLQSYKQIKCLRKPLQQKLSKLIKSLNPYNSPLFHQYQIHIQFHLYFL